MYKLFHKHFVFFPREDRILGQRIENIILEIIELTLGATYSPRDARKNIILQVSDKIDLIKHLIRIAYEIKSLDLKAYLVLEKAVLEIGKMCGGWLKSI